MIFSMAQWDFEQADNLGVRWDFREYERYATDDENFFSDTCTDVIISYRGIDYVRDDCGCYYYITVDAPTDVKQTYNAVACREAINEGWKWYESLEAAELRLTGRN